MINDPYLGITKPITLYESKEIIINSNKYINVKLYEKNRIKYYEVFLYDNEKQIFIGKYYEDDNIFQVAYKDGRLLIYTNQFNYQQKKLQINKVLGLYDIYDDIFYYCTEEEAIKLFDVNFDSSNLKNKNNKLLRTNVRKNISCLDNNLNISSSVNRQTEIIDISEMLFDNSNNLNNHNNEKFKIIKFHK